MGCDARAPVLADRMAPLLDRRTCGTAWPSTSRSSWMENTQDPVEFDTSMGSLEPLFLHGSTKGTRLLKACWSCGQPRERAFSWTKRNPPSSGASRAGRARCADVVVSFGARRLRSGDGGRRQRRRRRCSKRSTRTTSLVLLTWRTPVMKRNEGLSRRWRH